jgi:hypothetical protein
MRIIFWVCVLSVWPFLTGCGGEYGGYSEPRVIKLDSTPEGASVYLIPDSVWSLQGESMLSWSNDQLNDYRQYGKASDPNQAPAGSSPAPAGMTPMYVSVEHQGYEYIARIGDQQQGSTYISPDALDSGATVFLSPRNSNPQ